MKTRETYRTTRYKKHAQRFQSESISRRHTMKSNFEININESTVASIRVTQTMDSCTNKDNVSAIFTAISFIIKTLLNKF
jgi:hypothetical protein